MSRKIFPKASVSIQEDEKQLRRTDMGKLLFTSYQGRRCALYIQDNRLMAASFFTKDPGHVGAVYVGKIKNMVKNIDACFVEIAKGELCFLSLKNAESPYLLNRDYNGRLVEGDELLVQVIKDAQKNKKGVVTAQISLANEYFVITTGNKKVGFSSKLDKEEKQALENSLEKNEVLQAGTLVQDWSILLSSSAYQTFGSESAVPEHIKFPPIGCVVRTKAGKNINLMMGQFFSLTSQMFGMLYTAKYRSCFSCLKEAPADFEAILEQLPESDSWEIVTDQADMYGQLETYCAEHSRKVNIRFYQDERLPLSVLYSVESKLENALANRVWLKSGGYLVIDHTEALTVIDVNSGKCEAGKSFRDTYLRINMEAAEEIALQLRLRNLSGIILVDFINMRSSDDNRSLLEHLRTLVKDDKIVTKVIDMTPLGLVEITRKKINKPLREQFKQTEANA